LEHNGISEHEIDIYYDRAYQSRSTHKLHRLIRNQSILHHDERISKSGSEIVVPNTSEVLVITNTPKKHPKEAERRLDPIDSSMRSHQDEGNSGIIDPTDSTSDYLLDQLKFFFNQLRLRQR
jgi:hypothetical protein